MPSNTSQCFTILLTIIFSFISNLNLSCCDMHPLVFVLFIMVMKKRLFFPLCSNVFVFTCLKSIALFPILFPSWCWTREIHSVFSHRSHFEDLLIIVIAHHCKKSTSFLEYCFSLCLTSHSIALYYVLCSPNFWAIQPRMVLRKLSTFCTFLHNVSSSQIACHPLGLEIIFRSSPGQLFLFVYLFNWLFLTRIIARDPTE